MTTKLARDHLKAFVDRIERLEEEIKSLNGDKRDVYAEAKAGGFDVKALKIIIARRRKDADELNELDAIVEVYMSALGMVDATRARASDGLDIPEFLDRRNTEARAS